MITQDPGDSLFKAWQTTEHEDEVDQLVTARLDRQRIFEQTRPPSLWAVIDEWVLRRRIGGPKVMHDQLVHLAEAAERPMIKVHVIPAEVGAHIGLLGAFAIADLAGDAPGIVYFESPDQGETTRDPATVAKKAGVPVELVLMLVLVQAARVSRMIAAADQMTGWMVRRR
jgi:hypothetical protein